jgi:hypothetical protein
MQTDSTQPVTIAPTRRYLCRHIFTDGHRCGSPALRQEQFCYYHHASRRPAPDPGKHRYIDAAEPFTLPIVEDRASALLVISQILSRIASNDLDPTRAASLIAGLRVAVALLPRQPRPAPSTQPTPEPIAHRELIDDPILDEAHGPIAPIAELPQPTILSTLQAAADPRTQSHPPSSREASRTARSAYILVPNLGMPRDIPRQQRLALSRVQVYHLDPILPQPGQSTLKRAAFPNNQPPEPELTHQSRAVPARRQRRHHRHLPIAPLPSRPPERVGLAMRARIAVLHSPVVPRAQQPPIPVEYRRANRNPTLRQPGPRLLQRNLQHLL